MYQLSDLPCSRSSTVVVATALALGGVAFGLFCVSPIVPARADSGDAAAIKRADVPVRGLISRSIDPAPAGADAIRISVLGDGSGARFQMRLLSAGEDGVITGYYAAPAVPIDFTGWKTLIFPLSDFAFHADNNPDTSQDGFGTAQTLKTDTAVQIAVTAASARLYLDDLAWTTATAAPTDAPLAMIDDFESAAATNWQVEGDFNQLRSVSLGVNHIDHYVKSGGGSLSLTIRTAAQNEQQLNEPVLEKLFAKSKEPYVIYSRPPFETITPDSTPYANEILPTPTVSLFATPGQTEPTAFAVYAAKTIKDATVAMRGSLVSKTKGTMPASAVDVRVVRVALFADGPELLMKDDRDPLIGPVPKVRLTGDPATNIDRGNSKQFWVTVRVPPTQAPGMYTGKLIFSAPGVKPTAVTLNVDVLPVQLRTAHYQYGIDLLSVLGSDQSPGEQAVSSEVMAAQLADIRDHNIKIVILHDKPANLQNALQLYKDSGMSAVGPVVIASSLQTPDDFANVEKMRTAVGLSNAFDIYYRLPADEVGNADSERDYSLKVHNADKNALVVVAVPSDSVYSDLTSAMGAELAPMYSVSSDHSEKLMAAGKRATPNCDWWTWSIGKNDAIRNRLYAGFLLFKTGNGLYGAFPGPYQFVPPGSDPYRVFSQTETGSGAGYPAAAAGSSSLDPLPQMATFPVEGGVLDTVQWEAVREGIDDIRYIDAVKSISRELKDAHFHPEATAYADSFLIGIVGRPLLSMNPVQIQTLRRSIALQAVKLTQLLSKAPHTADTQ